MEDEAGYREWLDRGKLVVPVDEMNRSQNKEYRARAEQDATITHEINGMLQMSRVNATGLRVSVCDSDVTVVGCVADRPSMEKIVAQCERAKNVRSVINHLKISDHDPSSDCITTHTKIETHTHSHLDPEPTSFSEKAKESGFTATTTKLLASAFEALQR